MRCQGDQVVEEPAVEKLETWKAEVEQARQRRPFEPKRRKVPATVPPAARRQMALLDWIGSGDGYQLLAVENCPPLTPDMKALIAKGYCRLDRRFPVCYPPDMAAKLRQSAAQRITRIVVTEAGLAALAGIDIPGADHDYVMSALQTRTLR